MGRVPINPHILMVIATFIFGANYVIGRAVVGEVPPFLMGFVRWGAAAMIVLPFTLRHLRDDWDRAWRARNALMLAGFLMPFMGAGISYFALTKTIAINAGIVQTSLAIYIALLSWLILRERLYPLQALGVAAAILGVLTIVVRGDPGKLLDLQVNWGDAILVLCNLALAGYSIVIRRLPPGLHPSTVLTAVFVVGAACHFPFVVAEFAAGATVQPTAIAILGLLFVAIFPSVVAITCWNRGIAALGANRSGFYMYLVPIFSAVLAATFLGETIALYHVVGGALIVAGVTLSTRRQPAPAPAAQEAG